MRILFFALFLAGPLAAADALHGIWEGPIEDESSPLILRLTFGADNTLGIEGELNPLAVSPLAEPPPDWIPEAVWEELAALETRSQALESVTGQGTYQVSGDNLWVTYQEVAFVVDGQSLDAVSFWNPVLTFSVRFLFASFAVLFAEDLSEDELREEFLGVYESLPSDPEYQALVEQLPVLIEQSPLQITLSGTYEIEGDALFITSTTTDEEGEEITETVEFRQTDIPSSVDRTSWGSLKTMGPGAGIRP